MGVSLPFGKLGWLLLGESGLSFPINVSVMFVLSAVFYGLTGLVVDPGRVEPPSLLVLQDAPGQEPDVVVVIGWTAQARLSGTPGGRAVPAPSAGPLLAPLVGDWPSSFYAVYARRELGIQAGLVFLPGCANGGFDPLEFDLGRVSDGRGNRALIVTTTVVGMATLLIALLIGIDRSFGPDEAVWPWLCLCRRFPGRPVPIARLGHRPDELPDGHCAGRDRLYLAFNNTVFGLVRFAAMVSGLIVDWAGFRVCSSASRR